MPIILILKITSLCRSLLLCFTEEDAEAERGKETLSW